MSTFFDRLTNSHSSPIKLPPEPELASSKDILKQPLKKMNAIAQEVPEPSAKISVVEDEPSRPPHAEDDVPEEGELTVDIYDKDDRIVIQSTVAGVKPDHLDVAITDDTVTIRGKRERIETVSEDSYYYKELFWGAFSRSVILPEEINQEEAEAQLQHGLLTIRLPKKRRGLTQKLKVKVV